MEFPTEKDIWLECDALKNPDFDDKVRRLQLVIPYENDLVLCPMYACVMARLKYSMDREALPDHSDKRAIFLYYKRIFNTYKGASTWDKFQIAWDQNGLNKVKLS